MMIAQLVHLAKQEKNKRIQDLPEVDTFKRQCFAFHERRISIRQNSWTLDILNMFCYGETCCVQSAPELKEPSGEECNALKGRRTGLTEHQSHVLGEVGVQNTVSCVHSSLQNMRGRVLRVWVQKQSMGLETVGPEFYGSRSQTCRIGMWYSFVPCSLQNRSEPAG